MAEDSKITSVKGNKTPIYIAVSILVALVGVYFLIPSVREFLQEGWKILTSGEEEKIEEWVSQFGFYGPVLIIVFKILQLFLIIIPTIAMIVVSVLAYGSIWGGTIAVAAVLVAASVGYILGAYFGPVVIDKIVGNKSQEFIVGLIKDYGFWGVVITRVNPLLSSDAISFMAGSLKMHYWRFIGATLAGITPLVIFIGLIGSNVDSLITGLIWASVISIASFVGYIWWDKKRKKQD